MGTVSVRYIAEDVGAAVDFYTGLLGFDTVMNPGAGFAILARGDLRLLLNAPGAGGAGQATVDAGLSAGGWNRFQLAVDDLDAEVSRLRTAGVEFATEIIEGRGGRTSLIKDPAGNIVELFEPPARE
jgi:catechol 2,3-dioxygenase-like lactoylglutathione lyase family enzyme